jgi:hypothetical protein
MGMIFHLAVQRDFRTLVALLRLRPHQNIMMIPARHFSL